MTRHSNLNMYITLALLRFLRIFVAFAARYVSIYVIMVAY